MKSTIGFPISCSWPNGHDSARDSRSKIMMTAWHVERHGAGNLASSAVSAWTPYNYPAPKLALAERIIQSPIGSFPCE
jgi:hypothetical protein